MVKVWPSFEIVFFPCKVTFAGHLVSPFRDVIVNYLLRISARRLFACRNHVRHELV
jgi:hypothetical protein